VRKHLDGRTKVVAGLVGVQTNQFVRAVDLAHAFKEAGAEVVMGGFHVSGSISALHDGIKDNKRKDVPCPGVMPPDVQALMDAGVIVCHGEGEEAWRRILGDLVAGRAELLYRGGRPSLATAPLPDYPEGYFNDFPTTVATFDTGRGCPFTCSFCTIINVQGRDPRWRDPQAIVARVREICERDGKAGFFFTDDNFARNPHWEELLDGLIGLREEGRRIGFMIEADLAAYTMPRFMDKLEAAGCTQVFLGMESVNTESLKKKRKFQNRPQKYRELCDAMHERGIAVHAGYIIGFDEDTAESIIRDVETIKEVGVDVVSFFILTPLPGSEDHVRALAAGVPMDPDFNNYDSFHAVTDHPHMTRDELLDVLYGAFREFYRTRQMVAVMKRTPAKEFWPRFFGFLWYRNSSLGERTHPMNGGFISMRQRKERRSGMPREGLARYWSRELAFRARYLGHVLREFYIFQHVYYESKLKDDLADRLSTNVRGVRDWAVRAFRRPPTRRWLNAFWLRYGQQKWRLLWRWDWHLSMLPHAATEVMYTVHFAGVVLRNLAVMTKRTA
jgi:radical SAM superfamily enzyme YgiQ (UPF0313 family)